MLHETETEAFGDGSGGGAASLLGAAGGGGAGGADGLSPRRAWRPRG